MNRKISLGVAVALLCLVAAVSSAISVSVVSSEYNSILSGLPEKIERYEILDELDEIINNNYYGKGEQKNIHQAIAQGYVEGLGDGTSVYMTADEYAEYISEENGDMLGIGIEYTKNSDGYIAVTKVYDGSPAKSSGLKKGDVIIAFDGIRINEANYSEMESKLQGDKLTSVNIIYERDGNETNVTVVKGYEAQSVSVDAREDVGYIEISAFYPTTASQVEQAVDKLLSSQMTSIVIDLRNNTSGNYEQAIKTLDVFVPMSDGDNPAATVVDENGNVVKTYITSSGEVSLPIIVLVGKNTQKAAELFALNMRNFGKCRIVSDKNTKGNAIVQEIFELSNGSAVLLTTGKILSFKSESFEKTGITPDYTVENENSDESLETDAQFLYAVSLLKGEAEE